MRRRYLRTRCTNGRRRGRTRTGAVARPPSARPGRPWCSPIRPQVAAQQAGCHATIQPRVLILQAGQEQPNGLTEHSQSGKHGDVAHHLGRVQPLLTQVRPQDLDDAIRDRREGQRTAVMGHHPGTKIVQCLLRQMRLLRLQTQGMVPQQVELQALQRLRVGQIEHVLQDQHTQDGLHRAVGTTVVPAIQRREQRFVDQRQGVDAKRLRPAGLQASRLDLRHQIAGLEQTTLRIFLAKHQPLSIVQGSVLARWAKYTNNSQFSVL